MSQHGLTFKEANEIFDNPEDYYGSDLFCGACDTIIDQLRNRIAELEARTTWQPISSAPLQPVGDYLGFDGVYTEKMYWNYPRDGWVDCCDQSFVNPTHWMHLPEPPK